MSEAETLTRTKRAAIIAGIGKTWDAEVLEWTRGMLRDRGFLADADILKAMRDQKDRVHGVRR